MKKNLIIGVLLGLSFILLISFCFINKTNNNNLIGNWKLVKYVNYDGISLEYGDNEYSTEYLEFKDKSIYIVKSYENAKLLSTSKAYFKDELEKLIISNDKNFKDKVINKKILEKDKLIIETKITNKNKVVKTYKKVLEKELPKIR